MSVRALGALTLSKCQKFTKVIFYYTKTGGKNPWSSYIKIMGKDCNTDMLHLLQHTVFNRTSTLKGKYYTAY